MGDNGMRLDELHCRIAELTQEVERQRKRAALWKRIHWALLEGELGDGGSNCDIIEEECIEKLREMDEDPEHDAGDPGGVDGSAYPGPSDREHDEGEEEQ